MARGDVGRDADHRRLPARRALRGRVGDLEDQVADLEDLGHVPAGERLAGGGEDLRVLAVDVEHGLADDLARLEPERLEALALGQREHAVGVEREQHHRRRGDDRAHLVLRHAQGGLGAAQLGDVDEHALRVLRLATLVADDRLLVEDVDGRAVGGHEAVLEVDGDLLARMARELRGHPVGVVGMQEPDPELRVLDPALRRVAGQLLCGLM
jgi:hypothetical protein